jgi:hypothetical protein
VADGVAVPLAISCGGTSGMDYATGEEDIPFRRTA